MKSAPDDSNKTPGIHPYPFLARETVRRHLACQDARQTDPDGVSGQDALWEDKKACFVSIKSKDGSLRGCIGTILPSLPKLRQEIMVNAIAAATRDPRFPPMRIEELDQVVFSVDVLSIPEPVHSPDQLDPATWGVIVTKDGRRGVLLPDLEGVETVEQQLSIAAQKAGIADLGGATIERFRVERYPEAGEGHDRQR